MKQGGEMQDIVVVVAAVGPAMTGTFSMYSQQHTPFKEGVRV